MRRLRERAPASAPHAAREAARRSAALGTRIPRGAALWLSGEAVISAPELPDRGDGTGGCAERAALLSAVLQGHRRFRELHLAGGASGRGDAGPPCGSCLQILHEFAPALRVFWGAAGRPAGGVPVRDLLPGAFGPRTLAGRGRSVAGRTRTRSRART